MKKVLVTGATGFIGNYVISELLTNGYKVIATSSSQTKAAGMFWYDAVDYIQLDLETIQPGKDYFKFFKEPDILIHLAWEGLPNYKNSFHIDENLPRHYLFISNLLDNGLKDLTIIGTCFEYGMQEGKLSEAMPARPANPYAIAKDSLRKKIAAVCRKTDKLSFKWLRLFYIYGQGQSASSLIPQLERSLANNEVCFNMSGGEQLRDFLPVTRVAEYIVKAALQRNIEGIINICSGQPIKVKTFVLNYLATHQAAIRLNLGYYPYSDIEPMHFWGDDFKIQKILKQE